MTIEILNQGSELQERINRKSLLLRQTLWMLDKTVDPEVKTRVLGMEFNLPKAVFNGELTKQKKDLEDELLVLEAEFAAL